MSEAVNNVLRNT